MTESNESSLDTQIQHLLDGGLDEAQQLSLLQKIDRENPDAWRTVALGYIETDLLRNAFREAEEEGAKVTPFPVSRRSRRSSVTVGVAAVALILGLLLGSVFGPRSASSGRETAPLAEELRSEEPESIPPSFQAIESLDLALRDRGFEPIVSRAVYRAELPDGRRLLLPIQRLSFQPQ